MPLKSYGILKGRPIARRLATNANAHYQIHVVDETADFRIAVNVKSKLSPSELEYLIVEDYQHPILADLPELSPGFTLVERKPGGIAVDFIRGNFFDPKQMKPLPFDQPGPANDLNELMDSHILRALGDEEALIYIFGERWGPESKKDKIFGFSPGNGVHDVHMNQGNAAQFVQDDGVWQDGALFVHFPVANRWVAVFLKFQSQCWHTDDSQGHCTAVAEEEVQDGVVRIVAALVNPRGPAPEQETVTILNTSPQAIDLQGWSIADRAKHKQALSGVLAPGGVTVVLLNQTVQLGNKGGAITLLDQNGLKVDGISYTKEQAQKEGWTIVF